MRALSCVAGKARRNQAALTWVNYRNAVTCYVEDMKRILVIYYSRTGYTRRIAEKVAELVDADLEEISEDRTRKGIVEFFRSAIEAYRARPARIHQPKRQPQDYDLVVFGSPVWAGHVSSPMLGYLDAHWTKITDHAVFFTVGGSDGAVALAQFAEAAGKKPKAELILTDKEIDTGTHRLLVEQFAERLKALVAVSADAETRNQVFSLNSRLCGGRSLGDCRCQRSVCLMPRSTAT
jgi:NAD(P)H-dependent FMN reductase